MGYKGGGFGGPKEMFKATCAECKQECEVPFKPREDRPVYCKDCFSKRKDGGRQMRQNFKWEKKKIEEAKKKKKEEKRLRRLNEKSTSDSSDVAPDLFAPPESLNS